MHSIVSHRYVRRVKHNPLTAPLIIAAFALATISVALWLRTTGHPLGQPLPVTDGTIDYAGHAAVHAHTLGLVAILLAGYAFYHANNPDTSASDILGTIILSVALAWGVMFLTDSQSGLATVYETLAGRPLFTLASILIGATYFALLHTHYDWLALNLAAFSLGAPVIATLSHRAPLPILAAVLVGAAVIDYLAVHRSSVMETLAESMFPLRVPTAFFVPTTAPSLAAALDGDDLTGIRMLGLGDVALPGMFIVALAGQFSLLSLPVATALLGYIIAYAILTTDPFNLNAYAGLPFLNTGVLLGAALALPFL